METRAVGGSNAFNTGFNNAVLLTAGEKGPFRLPCESCTCLMPLFGMVPGESVYDSDLTKLHKGRVTLKI